MVGSATRDDAAVYDIGHGMGLISTTDFFMPIVDDPFTFGRIAATNAISDIYAMGGAPMMAIAILGWPVNILPPQVAGRVIDGGRAACADAGIALAGGHSIDAPEPIFGLAVTGRVPLNNLKRNDSAKTGAVLMLTKPLGVGILTTALKQGKLADEHRNIAPELMCSLNQIGVKLGEMPGISAMTDVTGFGLLGHLLELCEGSGVRAQIDVARVPIIEAARQYASMGCVPGGTHRNFESYGAKVAPLNEQQIALLCDPQTSGGLLLAVTPDSVVAVQTLGREAGLELHTFGALIPGGEGPIISIGEP